MPLGGDRPVRESGMPRTDCPALAGSPSLPGIPTDGVGISGDARLPMSVTLPGTAGLSRRGALRGPDCGGRLEGVLPAGALFPVGARQVGRLLLDPGTSLSTCFLKLQFKLLLLCTLGVPGTWKQKPGTAVPANSLVACL